MTSLGTLLGMAGVAALAGRPPLLGAVAGTAAQASALLLGLLLLVAGIVLLH